MKYLICDNHTHTNYSFDAKSTMEQYALRAINKGVDVVCFTDHIECGEFFSTYESFAFGERAEEFHRIKQKYQGKVKLLLGFEFGEPHLHKEKFNFIKSLSPDVIIGSVHYPLDYEHFEGKCSDVYYERLYNDYVRRMVEFGGFDVLGHMDLPKRSHPDYKADMETLLRTVEICAQSGIVPEINTSSLGRGRAEAMPSMDIVAHYVACGGRYVALSSDSHKYVNVGAYFEKVLSELPQGAEPCYFENRRAVSALKGQ